jgi:hypothetical protein
MIRRCQTACFLFLLSCLAFIPRLNATEFQFPVACQIMGNCWITNHVDLDDRIGKVSDYKCEKKASDNNKSTYISLKSLGSVSENIPVMAAADGKVSFAGQQGGFCGVRVSIDHYDGWQTNYCHLNPEFLSVTTGQNIKAGQILSIIGMSGQTDWPRLSFSTLRNGMVFDPFSGRSTIEGCSDTPNPLWVGGNNPPYEPASVMNAGFTVGSVSNTDIITGKAENATAINVETPQLSLWTLFANLRTNDFVELIIETPKGRVLNSFEKRVEKNHNFFTFYFSTLKKNILWDPGEYKGIIKITRNINGSDVTSGRIVILNMIKRPKYN